MNSLSSRLPPDLQAPARARHEAAALLLHQPPEVRDIALLLTSELVTNTVRHGVGEAHLAIVVESDHATIAVTDRGDGQVSANHYRWPEGGHGLTLVDALSDRWGVESTTGKAGKRVWFELTWDRAESA